MPRCIVFCTLFFDRFLVHFCSQLGPVGSQKRGFSLGKIRRASGPRRVRSHTTVYLLTVPPPPYPPPGDAQTALPPASRQRRGSAEPDTGAPQPPRRPKMRLFRIPMPIQISSFWHLFFGSIFHRFLRPTCLQLSPNLPPKIHQNRSKIDAKMHCILHSIF